MVNSAGIYFTLGEQVYLLCDESWGVVPIGVSVADFGTAASHLAVGQKVIAAKGVLRIPGGKILLMPRDVAEEPCAPDSGKWERAAELLAACGKTTGLSALCRPLLLGEPLDGANVFCQRAEGPLKALIHAIVTEKPEDIPSAVSPLLGLGVGLTPSGDDVLTGLLYGLRRSVLKETPGVRALTEAVTAQAPERTNRVSNTYLRAIAAGAPFERLENAWKGLDRRFPAMEEGLLEIGSNSGSEMLLGLLLAAKCMMDAVRFI